MIKDGPRAATALQKERVTLSSIAASVGITLAKFLAGISSGSVALISEVGHTLVDTAATIVTYVAVRTANRPPDEEHHYGHGKFENIAAPAETIVLFVLATVIVMHAWDRLQQGGGELDLNIFAFAVLIGSIFIDLNRVQVLRKVAREADSPALAADAIHFASDVVGSTLVMIGLAAAWMGFRYGDTLAAVGVAAFIAVAGWRLGRRTIDTLLDKAPEGAASRVREIVSGVPGVGEISQLRFRPGGTHVFGDLTVVVGRTLSPESVEEIKAKIVTRVAGAIPDIARRSAPSHVLSTPRRCLSGS